MNNVTSPGNAGRWYLAAALLVATGSAHAQPTGEQLEFFETKIRPVLATQCVACHNSHDRTESGLALDHRGGWQVGGERGAVIRPGRPAASRLIRAMRSNNLELRMPLGEPALSSEVIADFEQWIEMGAPDPRDTPLSVETHKATTSWQAIFEERLGWWSLQPIREVPPPVVDAPEWQQPVDRFFVPVWPPLGSSPRHLPSRAPCCGGSALL